MLNTHTYSKISSVFFLQKEINILLIKKKFSLYASHFCIRAKSSHLPWYTAHIPKWSKNMLKSHAHIQKFGTLAISVYYIVYVVVHILLEFNINVVFFFCCALHFIRKSFWTSLAFLSRSWQMMILQCAFGFFPSTC